MAQTRKAEATAKRVVSVAAGLFLANGFEATTIAQVAEGADVANGTVLLHFGSKSELATAAFADHIGALVAEAAGNVRGKSVHDDLRLFVGPLYRWYDTHQAVAPALLRQALFTSGPWAEYYQETVNETVRVLTAILDRHLLVPAAELELLGQGVLADYLLVLMQGLRGTFPKVNHQLDHFIRLTETRTRHYPKAN